MAEREVGVGSVFRVDRRSRIASSSLTFWVACSPGRPLPARLPRVLTAACASEQSHTTPDTNNLALVSARLTPFELQRSPAQGPINAISPAGALADSTVAPQARRRCRQSLSVLQASMSMSRRTRAQPPDGDVGHWDAYGLRANGQKQLVAYGGRTCHFPVARSRG
jgi:hypothetical protein